MLGTLLLSVSLEDIFLFNAKQPCQEGIEIGLSELADAVANCYLPSRDGRYGTCPLPHSGPKP